LIKKDKNNLKSESAKHHFASGIIVKFASVAIQTGQTVIVARILGQVLYAEYIVLTAITSVPLTFANAWSNLLQNRLTDSIGGDAEEQIETTLVLNIIGASSVVGASMALFAENRLFEFANTYKIDTTTVAQKFILAAAVGLSSLSLAQICSLSSRGKSLELGNTQLAGKILSLIGCCLFYVIPQEYGTPFNMTVVTLTVSTFPSIYFYRRILTASVFKIKPLPINILIDRSAVMILANYLIASFLKLAEMSAVLAICAIEQAAIWGILQRLFSSQVQIFSTGIRNLWGYWRRNKLAGVKSTNRKIRILSIPCISVLAGSANLFEAQLTKILNFSDDISTEMLIVISVISFSLVSMSLSTNVLAARDRQGGTLLATAILVAGLFTVAWLARHIHLSLGVVSLPFMIAAILLKRFEDQIVNDSDQTKQVGGL
jgi:hypothetical protein